MCLVNAVFMVLGICLNSVVIISLWKCTQLRKKLCYYMIFLLSCFDLAVVCIVHPILTISIIQFTIIGYNKQLVEINSLFIMFVEGCSLNALLALNCERFLGVVFPIFHRSSVRKKNFLYALKLAFIVPITSTILSFQTSGNSDNIFTTSFMITVLLVFLFINYKILKVARSRGFVGRVRSGKKKRFRNFKAALTSSLSVLCMVLCSSPFIIIACLCAAWKISLQDERALPYTHWSVTLVAMNSTFNCLLLFWRNSILYREGIKLIKRL